MVLEKEAEVRGKPLRQTVIIGSQLKKARELLQLTPEEVASELNASTQNIMDWEAGRSQPNLRQLEKLGELYGREIDYFLRETPTPPDRIEFRGRPGQSLKELSKEAKMILARFDELCRMALEFENLLNKRQQVKLPRFRESVPAKTVAQHLRARFNGTHRPISTLKTILENEGVRIFELPVPQDAFSGFSLWHPEYGPCILLNANEPKGRRNFTLAHELAHLLYSHISTLCYIPLRLREVQKGKEYKANQFAIELLLPESGVSEDFRSRGLSMRPSDIELSQMASKWGVSIQALGYRLESLGLIKGGHTDTLLEPPQQFFKRSRTPKWERQLGKGFVATAFEAYQRGLISIGKLAHSLGITVRQALEEIEKRQKA